GLVPAITLVFTNQAAPFEELVLQTVLLIGVPLVASRFLRRWSRVADFRGSAVSLSFFFLVVAIAGSTRAPLLAHRELLAWLAAPAPLSPADRATAVSAAYRCGRVATALDESRGRAKPPP